MSEHQFNTFIFDLDGTLTPSKSEIEDQMSQVFCQLLEKAKNVAVISGGDFGQFQKQFLNHLPCSPKNLYLLPTSGSKLLHFQDGEWQELYSLKLSSEQKELIIKALEEAMEESGLDFSQPSYGPRIEDRASQITLSGLGQDAPLEKKEIWDPDQQKRKKIVSLLEKKLPQFEISIGGSSSIDVTEKEIDKEYGVEKFLSHVGADKSEAIFFGDALFEGGNDWPVTRTGIKTVAVDSPAQTIQELKKYALY